MRDTRLVPILFIGIFVIGTAVGYIVHDTFLPEPGLVSPIPFNMTTIPPSLTPIVSNIPTVSTSTCSDVAYLTKPTSEQELRACLIPIDEKAKGAFAEIHDKKAKEKIDYNHDGLFDFFDFVLVNSGRVVKSSYNPEGVLDVTQFDFDCDGNFEVAWFDLVPRDNVIDFKVYDLDEDGRADFARYDENINLELDPNEIYYYDSDTNVWIGVGSNPASDTLQIQKEGPFIPFQFPFMFFYLY